MSAPGRFLVGVMVLNGWVLACGSSEKNAAAGCDVSNDPVCCPGKGGPSMVRLPEGYCIDTTEVTVDQYQAWLDTRPYPNQQIEACANNVTFAPPTYLDPPSEILCQGDGCGSHPRVLVDWCDAYAYCLAVGKRLCGKIGGGASAFDDYQNQATGQWFNACSSGGTHAFPYGDVYDALACNGGFYSITGPGELVKGTVPAGSIATCQASGSYAGVFDLSGNVLEWEDSCESSDERAICHTRGGSLLDALEERLRCDSTDHRGERLVASDDIGFRCCAP